MPFIRITVSGTTLSPRQIQRLHQQTADLMTAALGKRRELTSVLVEQPAKGGWAVGDASMPVSAHLEAKVTQGTNTAAEKARFIAEAMSMLKNVLGDGLDDRTYIIIDEIAGDAWGYGGRTQDDRREALASPRP